VPDVTAAASANVGPVSLLFERIYSIPMPEAAWFGRTHGEPPNVRITLKKFLLELSCVAVPENEHPELEPLISPLSLIVTVAAAPFSNEPDQLPEISEIDAGMS
jgi:hypothetical protein